MPISDNKNTKIYCRNCRANRSMKRLDAHLYMCNHCHQLHAQIPGGRIIKLDLKLPKINYATSK